QSGVDVADFGAVTIHPILHTQNQQAEGQKKEILPIRSLRPPPPEIPGSAIASIREGSLSPPGRTIVQGYFEQRHLHAYHEESLNQQREIISSAGPVENLEDGSGEHDQGDVEREAGRSTGPVDSENLVGVRRKWGKYEASIDQ
ncbi:MAG: hypothetical protein Q9183_005871, partial [Haloplaca sp. 2 TL-2023]